MDKKTLTTLYVVMILFVIGICIYIFFFLKGMGGNCVADPLVFYQNKINVTCFCVNNLTP